MNQNKTSIFVTGIGTDVGKTVASAILVQALGYDYWKPVQAGNLDNTDSMKVRSFVERDDVKIHSEYIRLSKPLSPHAAAEMDGVSISIEKIRLPQTSRGLIIEGAGGVMVPLNNEHSMIDLMEHFNAGVIIVSKHYLGSINHSLLTFEAFKSHKIPVLGWVFNGKPDKSTQDIILQKSGKPRLFSIYPENEITSQTIRKYADDLINDQKSFKKLTTLNHKNTDVYR
jgi:dethiobiotin synthetase